MENVASPSRAARGALIVAVAIAATIAYLLLPAGTRSRAIGSELLTVASCLGSAILVHVGGKKWPGSRHVAVLLALVGAGNLLFLIVDLVDPNVYRAKPTDVLFLVFLAPLYLALREEFRCHFASRDRREIAIDTGLATASVAAITYIFLKPTDADTVVAGAAGVFAVLGASVFVPFATLALWVPTRAHLLLFAAFAPASFAALQFGWEWANEMFVGSSPGVDIPWILAPLAVAATMTLADHGEPGEKPANISRTARPVLTSIAVMAACAGLALVAVLDDSRGISGAQSTALIVLLGGGLAARILANQLVNARSHDEVREALTHRETALREADAALDRVREANETLRRSEEHLRQIFEAAVDGFVELAEDGTIVRANDAFSRMVGLDRSLIEGQGWLAMAAGVKGVGPEFARLPEEGEARILRTDGQPLHLEARASRIPADPPRLLLLVRDVTAAKVADQTIRSLFQFLQDRDEDRTRLQRRTNLAIEQERNRIARDLHDGPVQGVSAASLSLEAALLMVKAGDTERGLDILSRIRTELADEAESLRRLMSGLRPPVLEERGLMPALRESLVRFGAESGVMTEFTGALASPVPDDIETLAYRVVQEALSNAGRHANASHVSVHVESDQTQLRIEVEDDGEGFDTSQARDFLHAGRVGLASMRERVELAGGTFAVRSTPGRGTAVMATVPLESTEVVTRVP